MLHNRATQPQAVVRVFWIHVRIESFVRERKMTVFQFQWIMGHDKEWIRSEIWCKECVLYIEPKTISALYLLCMSVDCNYAVNDMMQTVLFLKKGTPKLGFHVAKIMGDMKHDIFIDISILLLFFHRWKYCALAPLKQVP